MLNEYQYKPKKRNKVMIPVIINKSGDLSIKALAVAENNLCAKYRFIAKIWTKPRLYGIINLKSMSDGNFKPCIKAL